MSTPLLFDPITLRETTFANRLWVAPMCQYQATDGVANDWHTVHYGTLARGGAGLVLVEATAVVPEGRISPSCTGLWNDKQTQAFKRVTDVVHGTGGKIGIQLSHAGRKASTYRGFPGEQSGSMPLDDGGWETVAPSPVAFTGMTEPRELTGTEIEELIGQFVAAADRAVEAGFDAVELHAAHGYLLFEFLSPLSNFREDEWGGSLENRARMLLEVATRIRANHPDLPLLVRISASEWREDGFTTDDTTAVIRMLKAVGADFIDVSSAANVAEATIKIGPAYQTKFAGEVRDAGLPVSAVGLITSAEQAETILVTGLSDVVMIGRAALQNPYAPIHWAKELNSDKTQSLVPPSYFRAWRSRSLPVSAK